MIYASKLKSSSNQWHLSLILYAGIYVGILRWSLYAGIFSLESICWNFSMECICWEISWKIYDGKKFENYMLVKNLETVCW